MDAVKEIEKVANQVGPSFSNGSDIVISMLTEVRDEVAGRFLSTISSWGSTLDSTFTSFGNQVWGSL